MRSGRATLSDAGQRPTAARSGAHAADSFPAALVQPGREAVPNATNMLRFCRLLEQNKLGERLFAETGRVLQESGITPHLESNPKISGLFSVGCICPYPPADVFLFELRFNRVR